MPSARRVSWAKFRVSAVCFVALLILGILFWLLAAGSLLQPKANIYLYVPDATGLTKDSPVRVDGIGVGKVAAVEILDRPSGNRIIRVTIRVVRERLAIYRRAGVTTLRVDPGGATLEARLATLGRLMELVKAG